MLRPLAAKLNPGPQQQAKHTLSEYSEPGHLQDWIDTVEGDIRLIGLRVGDRFQYIASGDVHEVETQTLA